MVRVGGGWDTLQNYLDKHDPCRCRRGETSFDLDCSQLRFKRLSRVHEYMDSKIKAGHQVL